jgi:hypothetical protein
VKAVSDAPTDELRAEVVRDFLERRLFKYYRETPYDVFLSGKMKPSYQGTAENVMGISDTLVARLAAQPQRLEGLKALLRASVPYFASPIYIGVAKSLRARLLVHRRLIEKFKNAQSQELAEFVADSGADEEDAARDHSFAQEVSQIRDFTTHYLLAFTMEFPSDEGIRYDLENILNRINYPLCGRN